MRDRALLARSIVTEGYLRQVKRAWNFLCLILVATTLVTWQCTDHKTQSPLVIACAANAQFAMQVIAESFTALHGVQCQITTASSGKLTAQIIQGAPYDVFISADMKYPSTLYEQHKASGPPKIYANGKLVLWTVVDTLAPDLQNLHSRAISHIGLANPTTAPYGRAARQVLDSLHLDFSDRLVFGESISQVNQFIMSQAVEIGFTAKSVVVSHKLKDQGRWTEIDENLYDPIQQGVVAIKNQRDRHDEAQKFISYLLSDPGQKILELHGYDRVDSM